MTNLMQTGAAWLSQKLKAHAGTEVIYRAGGQEIPITATRALVTYEVVGRDGFTTQVQSHDWTITAADLVAFGEAFQPRQRHEIEAAGERFEVFPIDEKRPCYEPADAYGVMIVVHSKKVSS